MRQHWTVGSLLGVVLLAGGCTWNGNSDDERAREQRTRDEVARATEKAKPALQDAGREIGKAAAVAADEAQAAAEGVREGWRRGKDSPSKDSPVDINAASEAELLTLPGIGHRDARRIIDGRPYRDKRDLVSRGAITEEEYGKIRSLITSK
jgi:DNA uptake protein ComE-like DNA-binding protein